MRLVRFAQSSPITGVVNRRACNGLLLKPFDQFAIDVPEPLDRTPFWPCHTSVDATLQSPNQDTHNHLCNALQHIRDSDCPPPRFRLDICKSISAQTPNHGLNPLTYHPRCVMLSPRKLLLARSTSTFDMRTSQRPSILYPYPIPTPGSSPN